MPSDVPGMMSFAIRQPLGVVAGIAPFNFPLILATKKVCLALAAGNTFVLKPSEETSLLGLKIAEVFDPAAQRVSEETHLVRADPPLIVSDDEPDGLVPSELPCRNRPGERKTARHHGARHRISGD